MRWHPPSDNTQAIVDTIISTKWIVAIIRTLLEGPARFSGIRAAIPSISAKILTSRLRYLEEQGVIRRTIMPPPAEREVYELTSRGEAAKPIIEAILQWSSSFDGT
ncbi:MAG: helix-turn-helix domain-containing protein [Aliihoeflea sp.]